MNQVFLIAQIVLGLFTIVLIMLQSKGTGLGSAFGGDMGFYGTKRGAEKMIFIATIVTAGLFLLSSLLGVIVH